MVASIVFMVAKMADAGEPGQTGTIDLKMVNGAGIAPAVLEKSQQEVTRIFAGAGLAVRWTDAPRFTVQIVPQVLGFDRAASATMGVALRTTYGPMVQVFFKQVREFARTYDIDLATTLAHVIAHEVGHLLLGTGHAPTGLMQAEWDRSVVHEAVKGSLTFTEAQAERIRASRR